MVMMEWVQLEMAAAKEMGCPKEPWKTPPRGWLAAHPLTCRETGVYKSHLCTLSLQSDFLYFYFLNVNGQPQFRQLRKACNFFLGSPPSLATPSSVRH